MKEDNTTPVSPQGKREPGFYHVMWKDTWEVALYDGERWKFTNGSRTSNDKAFTEIDERRIERGVFTKQQFGESFDAFCKRMGNSAKAEEIIRLSDVVTERDKRIKELEAALEIVKHDLKETQTKVIPGLIKFARAGQLEEYLIALELHLKSTP